LKKVEAEDKKKKRRRRRRRRRRHEEFHPSKIGRCVSG
jgi:hypothetical protein